MNYFEFGEMPICEAGSSNMPVHCFICSPKGLMSDYLQGNDVYWHWYASNFMPRRNSVGESMYHIAATTKEGILEAVKEYVVPIYRDIAESLEERGE